MEEQKLFELRLNPNIKCVAKDADGEWHGYNHHDIERSGDDDESFHHFTQYLVNNGGIELWHTPLSVNDALVGFPECDWKDSIYDVTDDGKLVKRIVPEPEVKNDNTTCFTPVTAVRKKYHTSNDTLFDAGYDKYCKLVVADPDKRVTLYLDQRCVDWIKSHNANRVDVRVAVNDKKLLIVPAKGNSGRFGLMFMRKGRANLSCVAAYKNLGGVPEGWYEARIDENLGIIVDLSEQKLVE